MITIIIDIIITIIIKSPSYLYGKKSLYSTSGVQAGVGSWKLFVCGFGVVIISVEVIISQIFIK